MRRAFSLAAIAIILSFVITPKCFGAVEDESDVAGKNQTEKAIKAVSGYWLTQDKDGVIELYGCDNEVCGRFYWLQGDTTGEISRDTRNPDQDKRNQPLCKMQFMGGFAPTDPGMFENGWIYSPRHGATFSARMTLVDADTLDLHGYLLTPLLGESQVWTRTTGKSFCHIPKEANSHAPAVKLH